jgi:hypothetical protein
MRVLIACETSGEIREAFRRRGHNVWSCDLLPSDDGSPFHRQCVDADHIWAILEEFWDLAIIHPPCTYLSSSGLHWNGRVPGRAEKTEQALRFFRRCLTEPGAARRAIENPIGCAGTRIRPADQYIQPYEFGHDASKKTGLWLENLPPLTLNPAHYVKPRLVCKTCKGVSPYDAAFKHGCAHCGAEPGMLLPRWANQTDSGQNKLTPSADRWKQRSKTYSGIAAAMAEQWSF